MIDRRADWLSRLSLSAAKRSGSAYQA